MSIQKKSLISALQSAKKANLAKETGSSDVSKSSAKASPVFKMGGKNQLVAKASLKTSTAKKAAAKR
jgi:hypothetical protein